MEEEFEVIFEIAEDAAAGVAESEVEMGAQVEENAAVEEMANAPMEAGGAENMDDFAEQAVEENRPWVKSFKDFAKWSVKNVASAGVAFGIMYGLNQAMASKAHSSGDRVKLTDYLAQVEATFVKNKLNWDDAHRQKAADDALAYPWIDCTG